MCARPTAITSAGLLAAGILTTGRPAVGQQAHETSGVRATVAADQRHYFDTHHWSGEDPRDSLVIVSDSETVLRRFVLCDRQGRHCTLRANTSVMTMVNLDRATALVRLVEPEGATDGCGRSPFLPPSFVINNMAVQQYTVVYAHDAWRVKQEVVRTC